MPPSAPHRKCSRGGATTCYVYTASNIGARRAWNLPRKALRARKWREGRSRAFHQVEKSSARSGATPALLTVRLYASSAHRRGAGRPPHPRPHHHAEDVATHILILQELLRSRTERGWLCRSIISSNFHGPCMHLRHGEQSTVHRAAPSCRLSPSQESERDKLIQRELPYDRSSHRFLFSFLVILSLFFIKILKKFGEVEEFFKEKLEEIDKFKEKFGEIEKIEEKSFTK